MPLFRIETRQKDESRPAPRSRDAAAQPGASRGSWMALVAGGLAALLVLMLVAAFLISRYGGGGQTEAQAPAVAPAGAGSSAGNGAGGGAAAGAAAPVAGRAALTAPQLSHVQPINTDYPRDATIAVVRGEPITMAQLEARVRIARTLGSLAGDPVPSYEDGAALRTFQVQMLRRAVDVLLIQQAARAANVQVPGGSEIDAIDSFLEQVSASPQQLDDAMASNGVTQEMLAAWFADANVVDFYVQTELMGADGEQDREAVVRPWLDARWAEGGIDIYFYDPDQL